MRARDHRQLETTDNELEAHSAASQARDRRTTTLLAGQLQVTTARLGNMLCHLAVILRHQDVGDPYSLAPTR
jgi:hypothetical protein